MANDPVILKQKDVARIERMLLAFESDANRDPLNRGTATDLRSPQPIRVILLDDLESDGSAEAAITVRIDTTEVQEVAIVGTATGGAFQLSFQSAVTTPLSHDATAEQMQAALQALETIGADNVRVAIGNTTEHKPFVWLVAFVGKFLGKDVPLMTVAIDDVLGIAVVVGATSHWIDTGEVRRVYDMIPVGTPTPQRAGAVALALWYEGVGYGVHACECRDIALTNYL